MGYRIQEVHGNAETNSDIAGFLAAFVRDGELGKPKPGDDDALVWAQRFRGTTIRFVRKSRQRGLCFGMTMDPSLASTE